MFSPEEHNKNRKMEHEKTMGEDVGCSVKL